MKICQNCGKENLDNAVFCMHCGKPLEGESLAQKTEVNAKQTEADSLKAGQQANRSAFMDNAVKGVFLAVLVGFCFFVYSFFSGVGDIFGKGTDLVKEKFAAKEINITEIILQERAGIQELAVVNDVYTITKDKTKTQGFGLFDYVTQKFICDLHYNVKYGYDLASLTKNDIEVNKVAKTVKVKLPKGKIIANELMNTKIRHNEGILFDFNKVKAEEIDAIQQEAKAEAATKGINDEKLLQKGEDQMKLILEKIIHSVAPDYSVVIARA